VTIIVVDDHKMFRESIVSLLKEEPFCTKVAEAGNVPEGRRLVEDLSPDVALVDMSFPGEGGSALIRWAVSIQPEMKLIVLSMHEEIGDLRAAIDAGAKGYVTKNAGYEELRAAIMAISTGGYYLDQAMLRRVFQELADLKRGISYVPSTLSELTERERDIFNLMIQDMSPREIGNALFISVKTVENHRSNIYRKLDIHDRYSLFAFAEKNGLID